MKKKNLISLLTAVMIMVLSIGALAGCGEDASAAEAGTLVIKVNPEIAVDYDDEGKVVGVRGLNDDGKALVESYSGFEGRASDSVVTELVTMIHEAGYFETEIEGEGRQITIEIEKGSEMPNCRNWYCRSPYDHSCCCRKSQKFRLSFLPMKELP